MGIIRLPLNALQENATYKTMTPPMSPQERADLKSSIAKVGILDPLYLEHDPEADTYTILDGYNRFAIAQEVGLAYVPCLLISTLDEKDTALKKNALRRQLTEEQRLELLGRGKADAARIELALIPPLARLHREGKLTSLVGHTNLRWLIEAPPHRQEEFLAEFQSDEGPSLTPASADEGAGLSQATELQEKLAYEQRRSETLRKQLETVKGEADRNRIKLEHFDHDIETAIAKRYKTEQAQQQEQTIALSKTIQQLKRDRETLQEQLQSMERHIESAEAESKAAQYAAHQAEAIFNQHMQKLISPKMLIGNLDLSIQVLDCAIAQAARHERLPEEDHETVRVRLDTLTDRLALLKKTVRTHRAEIIDLDAHRTPGDSASLLRQTS